ncbi:MAG TPA: hypothetical protein VHD31_03630 [Candidatus Paceibacterota bacterium]|nr:hypothetical protein [Candidatus Paceibacterota bacterium]
MDAKPTVGFIGQGFIGKNYADDFERRGYGVVRYALEPQFASNKEKIADCEFVLIAVPTPTTPEGFDDSVLRAVLPLVGIGKTAVIKSTTYPGTAKKLQALFPDRTILHSPEFLRERTAAEDAAQPKRNLIGLSQHTPLQRERAETLLAILPSAPYIRIADATETELIKYAGNAFLFFKVLYANFFYDLAQSLGVDYETVADAVAADPRIGPSHLQVIDQSGHNGAVSGRGAGGHCLIKDFAALRELYEEVMPGDKEGSALLRAFEQKNAALLKNSGKDLDLLNGVYGDTL